MELVVVAALMISFGLVLLMLGDFLQMFHVSGFSNFLLDLTLRLTLIDLPSQRHAAYPCRTSSKI